MISHPNAGVQFCKLTVAGLVPTGGGIAHGPLDLAGPLVLAGRHQVIAGHLYVAGHLDRAGHQVVPGHNRSKHLGIHKQTNACLIL